MHFKECCNRRCILTSGGVILVAFGIFLTFCFHAVFRDILYEQLKLRPTSRGYDAWVSPPFPLSMDVYFFNWTNPEDLWNHTSKPILEELGPYRFTERPEKVDIEWHDRNATVSYRKKSVYFFDEEGSNGSLDDVISSINVVALSAAHRARSWNYVKQKGVSMGLNLYNQKVYVAKTAGELLFDGYEDDMVLMGKQLFDASEVPFDRVGWFYTRNNSADLIGHYNVHTGVDDIAKIGSMAEWNYKPRTDFFADHCGMLNGSAGEFYTPNLSKDVPIQLFTPDMCRSLPLDFEREEEVAGIRGYKYAGGPRTVDNGTMYPETACFSAGEIVPSGVLNISACRFGTPVFMSFPHYYGADEYYLKQVEGLSPDKSKHQFYMTMEPTTGIPLEVAARFQLNILIEPHPNIALYEGVKRVFLPVLWFEQHVTMKPEFVGEIGHALSIPTTGRICGVVMLILGITMIVWTPADRMLSRRKRRDIVKDTSTDKALLQQNLSKAAILLPEKEKKESVTIIEAHPLIDHKPVKLVSENGTARM
ncbi:protein peste [Toxorhynchites rutilus septentrionalis]|uniref:protein peste n=1 Tax=Toxorhynchites rutilus septentrionalis TaxID=329112 RepID=UPI00247A4E5F|nr:protein peste [Toxorhynchites rutilus septentrionalis]XP_055642569.1 protein peste [Toxorhynchites rutilus septentrionalis]XP_055642570.1 protein peste [Toxorhynchites rutilus septentrionalis]XP_055642571.1 protein peste [Toxorhynchites rutilus septentrionalis]XP_055642572.1 protein peste [Toxorhynchites rutilus septentrionalis]XP_055642574.1 protein peste [Toxorhynchites rutilus septentrionalis]